MHFFLVFQVEVKVAAKIMFIPSIITIIWLSPHHVWTLPLVCVCVCMLFPLIHSFVPFIGVRFTSDSCFILSYSFSYGPGGIVLTRVSYFGYFSYSLSFEGSELANHLYLFTFYCNYLWASTALGNFQFRLGSVRWAAHTTPITVHCSNARQNTKLSAWQHLLPHRFFNLLSSL